MDKTALVLVAQCGLCTAATPQQAWSRCSVICRCACPCACCQEPYVEASAVGYSCVIFALIVFVHVQG